MAQIVGGLRIWPAIEGGEPSCRCLTIPSYDSDVSTNEPTRIVDLSTYFKRLLRHSLWALVAPLAVLTLGAAWTLTTPPSYEAKAALFVQLPKVQSEAEATQQSIFAAQLAASDLAIAQNSAQIAELVIARHPSLDADSLRSSVDFESKGLALTITATAETPDEAAALANDTAEAFTEVMGDLKTDTQPVLAFTYQIGAPASPILAATVSGKIPRLIITVAAAGIIWILAMVILDAKSGRSRVLPASVEGRD